MVTTDYHSGFVELDYLPDATSETIVGNNLSRHSIPQILVSDNGLQFSSAEFIKFVRKWQFVHEASSQASGVAEAAVQNAF